MKVGIRIDKIGSNVVQDTELEAVRPWSARTGALLIHSVGRIRKAERRASARAGVESA